MFKRSQGAKKSSESSATSKTVSAQEQFTTMLKRLLGQHKYRQALDEIKNIRRTNPDIKIIPSEGEVWLHRGQHEFERGDLRQAEQSFRRSLELGHVGPSHYWLARTLVQQNKLDDALTLIQTAFEQGALPKDHGIYYLKLLLLKGDLATVEQLIAKQSKKFYAAQLHWARGVLALKQEQPDEAIAHFNKIKRPVTPEDRPTAWQAYAYQQKGAWEVASSLLGIHPNFFSPGLSIFRRLPQDPLIERLSLYQRAKVGQPPLGMNDLEQRDATVKAAVTVAAFLQLVDREDYHNAAHVMLNAGRMGSQWSEMTALRPAVFTLAGQQAMREGETTCTETFWKPILAEQFDPQLAVNLLDALDTNESYAEAQRLVTRLIKWVEQDGKKHPENWPGDRLPLTLAHLYCRQGDMYMAAGKARAAFGSITQAERIYPQSPEVIGRQGLVAAGEDNLGEAVRLLTQALEKGCQTESVYDMLLEVLDEQGNSQAKLEARRRFGKAFGDMNPEQEIHFEPWLDALYTQRYSFFRQMVQNKDKAVPPMRACQIFVEAAKGNLTSTGKTSIDQGKATKEWDALLSKLSPEDRMQTLMAIALSIHLFAKRDKGIAALANQYTQRLFELSETYPKAAEAHVIVLATRESNQTKLTVPVETYIRSTPQPGNTLALVQLQVRRFGSLRHLLPFIETALQREPQNPLLLLAKATTSSPLSTGYGTLRDQGFDIARRIQDAKALQAFREEEAFVNIQDAHKYLPDPDTFDPDDEDQMMDVMEGMIRAMFGQKMSKAELDRMMPELMDQMMNSMPPPGAFDDEDDFDEDDLDAFFGRPKKRKTFRDL